MALASALSRRPPAIYAIWIAVLIVVYYSAEPLRIETWGLLILSGITAVVTGVWRHRPARKAPWLLLAAALTCFAVGQMSFLIAQRIHVALPFPSFADGFYLACYPLFAAGLLGFVAARSPHGDRRALVDGLTLTAGLALLSWTFLIRPYVHDQYLSGIQKTVAIAYPLGDVLVLALLARLLAPGIGGTRAARLLTLGVAACLAGDAAYGAIQLYGTFSNGGPTDLGWALFYSACGAAALQPDMASLTEPVPGQQATVSPIRLALLSLAALIAPVLLLTRSPGPVASEVGVIAVFSAILYMLVLIRLWDAAASQRRSLDRERILRQAALALTAATDLPRVAEAVTQAAAALLGRHAQGTPLLGVREAGAIRAVTETGSAADLDLAPLADTWPPLATGTEPVLFPMRDLSARARAVRPAAQWMLVCPSILSDAPAGETVGLIAVFGEHRPLTDLAPTLEILAHQAALTIERMRLRQEVIRQRSEAYFRALVQDASDAILIVADDGTVTYATPSTASVFGTTPMPGNVLWDLVADGSRDELAAIFLSLRQSAPGPRTVDLRVTRRDGRRVHVQARCSDLRSDPSVSGLVLTLRDVTAQHQLEEELKHQAFHDALTGLPNRALFQERIAQQVAVTARTGTVTGVLFIDLDDFKDVNDTLGHAAGDELLSGAAERLAGLVRGSDTAARLGGDEFALLISDAADAAAVESAAERVVSAFSAPFLLGDGLVTISVTVGVSTTHDSADTDQLLRHADLALYAAKASGKQQWRRYQKVLSADLGRRRELREALEDATARSAFALVYQPIVDLAGGTLAGFEALLRWPHPTWGMLLPGQFIALAEETGQIVPIGAWVLRQAAADIKRWRTDERGVQCSLYVSVNVSARQFADPDFGDMVRWALDESGLDPAALVLELTETALLPSGAKLLDDLATLKSIGVKLAIDDFGTGYSSLSYLRELPADLIKMDKSFVDGIADSERQLALAAGIVQIAASIGAEVIAEGIETEAQRDLLTAMGCTYGQGYLLAMPMQPSEAEELAHLAIAVPAGKSESVGKKPPAGTKPLGVLDAFPNHGHRDGPA